MPDSQFQRPGALLVPSHSEKVRELLQRARDLETQLATLGKLDEDKAAQLRSHLCEVISDLIITDPAVSREHDMATTLWRSCFYIPICSFRKEISKVKRRKGSSPAVALEHQFKKFLSEALALYDYLSIQYQSKLMPGLTQTNSQDISQESELPSAHVSTVGVVEGLYRLFIYTGDLHRYAESYDKAIICYLSATRLSPGNGNPYNQLAVVSQMKDPYLSMNALYWYCRSLLATHSSFETSSNNLERLFTSNREHLQEHSRGEPPIFVPDKKNPLTSAQKQAAVKSCLSHFVDFHFDILQQVNESTLRAKLAGIFKSLESLLEASAFSDQLLFKLVIINAFGIEKCNNDAHRMILVEFMLQLGQTFSDRLTATMAKMLEKPNDPKQLSSIRLLLPLLVIVELLARALVVENNLFWEKVASVGTLIRRFSLRIDTIDELAEPEDFQTLKGYRPFKFLKPEYVAGSPFVDENEAVLVLGLQATQTQSSKIDTKNEETKARMVAFVRLCDSCCAQDSITMHFDGEAYMCRPVEPDETSNYVGHEAEGDQHDADMEMEPDDDGGDVVTCASPGTPAPADSSSSGLPLNSRSDEPEIRNSDPSKPVGDENPRPLPAAVMPPPGFGFRESVVCGTRRELDSAVAGCMAPPPHAFRYNIPSQWPTGPEPKLPVDDMLTHNQDNQHQRQMALPREDIWNGIMLPTQNPFATPMPRIMPTHNWSQAQQEAYTPIADMLGSGLLESIFMSDSPSKETRNPFAW